MFFSIEEIEGIEMIDLIDLIEKNLLLSFILFQLLAEEGVFLL